MAIIKARNKRTGQVVTFEWNQPVPPSPLDIERAAQGMRPPSGLEPKLPSPALPSPEVNLPATATGRTSRGMGDLDTQKSTPEAHPYLFGAVPSAAAAARSALDTPIVRRLPQSAQDAVAGIDSPRLPTDMRGMGMPEDLTQANAEVEGQLRGFARGATEAVTPGHILGLLGLKTQNPLAIAATNAPFVPSGISKAIDPEASGTDRALGAVEAIGGGAGTAAGLPGSFRRIQEILGGGFGGGRPNMPPVRETYAPRVNIQPNEVGTPTIRATAPLRGDKPLPSIPQGVQPEVSELIAAELNKPLGKLRGDAEVGLGDLDANIKAEKDMGKARVTRRVREEREATIAEQRADREAYEANLRAQQELEADTARLVPRTSRASGQLNQIDQEIAAAQRQGATRRDQNARSEATATAQEQRADAEWYRQQQAAEAARVAADEAQTRATNVIDGVQEILGSEDAAKEAAKLSKAYSLSKSNVSLDETAQLARPVSPRMPRGMPARPDEIPVQTPVEAPPAASQPEDLSWVQRELDSLPNPGVQENINPRIDELRAQFDEQSPAGKVGAAKFMELVHGGLDPDEAFMFVTTGEPLPAGAPRPVAPTEAPLEQLPAETPQAGMFTSGDLPPMDTRVADWLRQQPWFSSLSKERRAELYRELGGLQSEAKKIMPDEGGFIDPRLAGRLGSTLAGGAAGATQGDTPGERIGYGVLGGAAGYGGARGIEALIENLPALRQAFGAARSTPEVGQAPFTGDLGDGAKPTATFLGFQETMDGGKIPLFNITGGERHNSTVSLSTLKEMGIEPPPIPGAGGDESGFIRPDMLSTLWKAYPSLRAAVGGTIGYNSSDEHPYTGALVGGLAGVAAAPSANSGGLQALNWANRAAYESMLAGPAQISNVLGNASTLLTSPFLEGSRGNLRGAITGFRALAEPDAWKQALGSGLKTGYLEQRPMKYTNELPLGPSGRTLNAVDRATKDMLEAGGMQPEMAAHYTLTEDPVTDFGKGLQMIQRVPGVGLMTPFIRTLVKQMELGAAHSPLRHIIRNIDGSAPLAETFPVSNPLGVTNQALNPFQYTAMLPGAVAAYLGAQGLGSASPNISAAYGGLAAPYSAARTFYDYKQHGRDSGSDFMRAAAQQIPLASDLTRMIEDPARIPGSIAQRFVPPSLMAFGDKAMRDPRSDDPQMVGPFDFNVEGYIKERLPWERESLPIRPDFFGQPQQRTWFGGAPDPLYVRDPRAAALAEMGLLRRSQSPALGGADLNRHEASDLQSLRGQQMMAVLGPFLQNPDRLAEVPNFLENLPPNQRQMLDEQIPSSVPRDQADIYRILQQQGINLGTLMFRMQRLQQQAQGLTPQP